MLGVASSGVSPSLSRDTLVRRNGSRVGKHSLVALTACSLTLGACSVDERPDASSPPASERLHSQAREPADAALVRFERDNPECPLWTDWRKTCSRTGPAHSMLCVTDPGRVVRPSEPFCVKAEMSGVPGPFTENQRMSSLRFCRATRLIRVTDASGQPRYEQTICHRYRIDRPFNGRRPAARRHPMCNRWSRGAENVLTCVQWRAADCEPHDGVPRPPARPSEDQVVIPQNFDPEATATFGVFCTR